jgi:polyferredoxin
VFTWTRWAVLLTVLAISTAIGLLHQKSPELRLVGVDALCPFGGVESLWRVISDGVFLKRIAFGSFALLGAAVGTNLLLGRVFCGQFCPLGTLQEIFGSLRNRLGIRRRELPSAVDVPARFLKYAVLGVFTWLTWRTATLVIRPYDPWVAYHHLTSAELFTEFGIGAAVLGISLAGSFVYDRFFCKYLCPTGAFLGLFNKLSFVRIARHEDACIDCGACDKACPANIKVSTVERHVADSECIACGQCVVACPKPESALRYEGRSGSVFKPATVLGLSAAVIFGVVAVSTATGRMEFTKPALAQQMDEAGHDAAAAAGAAQGGQGQGAGAGAGQVELEPAPSGAQFDVSLIRGYMTMREISTATGIPGDEFTQAFGVPEAALDVPMKDLKNSYPFDTQAVREFVAGRLGVPSATPDGCE